MAAEDASAEDFDVELKLLFVGDSGVGKTCIMLRFCEGRFNQSFMTTIGIDMKSKMLKVGDKTAKLQLFDTAGQERFRTLSTSFFRKAQGALLVYDVSERASFDATSSWLLQLQEHGDASAVVILVANKADLPEEKREVTREEGEKLAKELGVPFFEVSAKTGTNVEEAFVALCDEAIKRGDAAVAGDAGGVDLEAPPKIGKGCACSVM